MGVGLAVWDCVWHLGRLGGALPLPGAAVGLVLAFVKLNRAPCRGLAPPSSRLGTKLRALLMLLLPRMLAWQLWPGGDGLQHLTATGSLRMRARRLWSQCEQACLGRQSFSRSCNPWRRGGRWQHASRPRQPLLVLLGAGGAGGQA